MYCSFASLMYCYRIMKPIKFITDSGRLKQSANLKQAGTRSSFTKTLTTCYVSRISITVQSHNLRSYFDEIGSREHLAPFRIRLFYCGLYELHYQNLWYIMRIYKRYVDPSIPSLYSKGVYTNIPNFSVFCSKNRFLIFIRTAF